MLYKIETFNKNFTKFLKEDKYRNGLNAKVQVHL